MASIINADNGVSSGSAGLKYSADSSGVLELQTSGTATLSIDTSGNINIPGTGKRITGDFSNATLANRLMFQSSTTNGATLVGVIPNGTGTSVCTRYFNNASTENCAQFDVGLLIAGTEARIASAITGTGTYVPITMSTGGSERLRIDTSGNVGVGTSSPASKLDVNGTLTATSVNSQNTFGFKNRIINGAMMIDQRNAGASVTATTSNLYTLDRWQTVAAVSSKFTVQQSSTAPAGFINSLLATSSSAYTVGSTEYFFIRQKIEGLNMSDFGWGTASASTVTLSFWVRSSLTGTFGGAIRNSAQDRSYPFSYTISAANTWEQKTITIAGDTTGTWLTTNGIGLELDITLGAGSSFSGTAGAWSGSSLISVTGATSVVGTSGATFYITGVQLEKGSTATSFDYRPYGTELALCQRYCNVLRPASPSNPYVRFGIGVGQGTGTAHINYFPPVTMRTQPSITTSSASNFAVYDGVTVTTCSVIVIDGDSSPFMLGISAQTSGGLTSTRPYELIANNNYNALLTISAEL